MPSKSSRQKQVIKRYDDSSRVIQYDDKDEFFLSEIFAEAGSDFDETASLLYKKYSQWQCDSLASFASPDDMSIEQEGGYMYSPPSSSTIRQRGYSDEANDSHTRHGMECQQSSPFFDHNSHGLSITTNFGSYSNCPSSDEMETHHSWDHRNSFH